MKFALTHNALSRRRRQLFQKSYLARFQAVYGADEFGVFDERVLALVAQALALLHTPADIGFDAGCDAPELHGPERMARLLYPGPEGRKIDARDQGHLERCYAGAVRQADDQVALLLERLEANGLMENTIVVITSDHGEEIGERGMFGHGHTLYDELLLVPLMLTGPGTGEQAACSRARSA